jgi:hypothetical protein
MKMPRFTVIAAIFFLLSGAVDAAEKDPKQTPSGQFSETVETLLATMTATKYQHNTEIDEDAGVWKCDCSGLIGHILRCHFPEAYLHIDGKTRPERVRPLAANFCETFIAAGKKGSKGNPWRQIAKAEDLRPGDILAWKKRKIEEGSTTGHVLMIASIPKIEKNGLYHARVIDSTRGLHANDTRTQESLGVGSGEMWLSADKDRKLNGFKNNAGKAVSTKNTLAVGRIIKITGATTPPRIEDRFYLGLTTGSAKSLAKKRGVASRMIKEDGETHSVTRKVDKTRVNFVIKKGN